MLTLNTEAIASTHRDETLRLRCHNNSVQAPNTRTPRRPREVSDSREDLDKA